MAQIIVRNLDDAVRDRLRRRAARRGRSMEEEVRDILGAAVARDEKEVVRLGTAITRRFQGIGLEEDIPEFHGQAARPVEFDA